MTGFTLNQIKRGIERVEKKVDRIMEVPMKNAITFFKTANTEIMNGRFNDAYKNLNLVVVKSNEAFELTATKYINVETFNECTKALKLIIYSTILKYCYNEEKKTFEVYSNISPANKKIIAVQLEEIAEKCIKLKPNVKTTKFGFERAKKKEASQNVLDEILKITYPFISEGFKWSCCKTDVADNLGVTFKLVPHYLPEGEEDEATISVGKLHSSDTKLFVWKEENNAFVKRIEDKDPEHYQKFDFQSDKEEISVTINFSCLFLQLQVSGSANYYCGHFDLGGTVNGHPYYVQRHSNEEDDKIYLFKDRNNHWRSGLKLGEEEESFLHNPNTCKGIPKQGWKYKFMKNQWEDVKDDTVTVAVGEQVTCKIISVADDNRKGDETNNTGRWHHGYPRFDETKYDCTGGVWEYDDNYMDTITSVEVAVCPNLVKTWDDSKYFGSSNKIICSTHT